MNYKKILISEAEKRRIKHIHDVSRRNEFRNLLKEEGEYNQGVDPKVAEWFKNKISKELPGFPTDGYAFSIEDPAEPGTMVTVWEVLNPDNNLKYYLFTDGRAQNAKGEMATNRWHTDSAPTFDQTSQEGTSSQQTSTDPSKDPGLVNKDEMDARKKQEKEKKRQEKKKQRQDSKKARQNCRTYNGYFEKGKTTLNPDEKKTYVEFLDGCCDIFLKMNKNRLTKRITIAAESAEDGTLMRPYCQAVEYDTLEKV